MTYKTVREFVFGRKISFMSTIKLNFINLYLKVEYKTAMVIKNIIYYYQLFRNFILQRNPCILALLSSFNFNKSFFKISALNYNQILCTWTLTRNFTQRLTIKEKIKLSFSTSKYICNTV